MSSKHWQTYLGVAISLDNGALEKLVLLCSFLGYKYKYTQVCTCMWVKSPFPPKNTFVRACLDTILQAELWATYANPEAVWCDT